jgi:uncharacterized RDD family membrane protein YckC
MMTRDAVRLPDWFWFSAGLVPPVLCAVVLLGCLLVLTPSRRALHDLLSGTAVYMEEDVVRDAGHAFKPILSQAVRALPLDDPLTVSA